MRSDLYKPGYDPEVGLWVAKSADVIAHEVKNASWRPGLLQRKKIKRTIFDQHGNPVAQVVVHDSGNSEHEWDDHQDCVARPDPIMPKLYQDYLEWEKRMSKKGWWRGRK